ncbi:hypothetical protein BC835DRAFT_1304463 [Cytidiella melzeri]|nr:hypothetical protein BC835DRAFT_1304463 [Cytidiella melzeri]
MAKTKKKAQVTEASEDDHSDADNPQAPHATSTTRCRVLNYEDLLKRAAKLERENKALKWSKAKEPGMRANVQDGIAATIQPLIDDNSDGEDAMVQQDNHGNNDSPEEEDNKIIIYKSLEPFKQLSRARQNGKDAELRSLRRCGNRGVNKGDQNESWLQLVELRHSGFSRIKGLRARLNQNADLRRCGDRNTGDSEEMSDNNE